MCDSLSSSQWDPKHRFALPPEVFLFFVFLFFFFVFCFPLAAGLGKTSHSLGSEFQPSAMARLQPHAKAKRSFNES